MLKSALRDTLSIDPRNPDTFKQAKRKYLQNPYNPESVVITYEERQRARERLRIIKECRKKKRKV
jgi:hypothetical protein